LKYFVSTRGRVNEQQHIWQVTAGALWPTLPPRPALLGAKAPKSEWKKGRPPY